MVNVAGRVMSFTTPKPVPKRLAYIGMITERVSIYMY
jgi:hypothetical protein